MVTTQKTEIWPPGQSRDFASEKERDEAAVEAWFVWAREQVARDLSNYSASCSDPKCEVIAQTIAYMHFFRCLEREKRLALERRLVEVEAKQIKDIAELREQIGTLAPRPTEPVATVSGDTIPSMLRLAVIK